VWSLLTGEAAARFAIVVEKKDIVALKQRLAEFKAATLSGDSVAHVEAANRFFYVITAGLGNAVLSEMIVKLLSRINFLRSLSMARVETRRRCISSLTEIVAALQKRDPEAARAATRRHIAAACQAVVEIAA
jgi:DNA-binding GntR family transcriptional regulator